MPGFRYCSWCDGKGCMCCDAERKKWEKAEAERQAKKADRSSDEIRQSIADLRWVRDGGSPDGVSLGCQIAVAMNGRDSIDKDAVSAEIAREEAALDAAYKRQFPDGSQPIFTARRDNPGDMELLGKVFGREAIEHAFGPDGDGVVEIERNAAEARGIQSLRHLADPEGNGTEPRKGWDLVTSRPLTPEQARHADELAQAEIETKGGKPKGKAKGKRKEPTKP